MVLVVVVMAAIAFCFGGFRSQMFWCGQPRWRRRHGGVALRCGLCSVGFQALLLFIVAGVVPKGKVAT